METIIATGESALTGPFDLVQGGLGLAYRHPIDLPFTGYWGLGSVVVDADAYLASAAAIPGVSLDRTALRTVNADGTPGAGAFWGNPTCLRRGNRRARPAAGCHVAAGSPSRADRLVSRTGRPHPRLRHVGAHRRPGVHPARARQRRREVSDRLSTLSALVPGMLYQMRVAPDGSTSVPYASAGISSMFGFTPADVAEDASPMWERVDPADASVAQESMARAVHDGSSWHQRLRMRDGNGDTRWYLADATSEPDPPNGVMLHGLLTDVTDEVTIAEQIRISASVFASTRDGIIIMAPDGRILDVNPGFTAMTGYGADDVRGHTLEVLGSGLTPQDVYDDVRMSLDRDGFWRESWSTTRAPGRCPLPQSRSRPCKARPAT